MANRHLSRTLVLQALFEWDFCKKSDKELPGVIARVSMEFAPGMADGAFMEKLAKGILAKKDDLDLIIVKAAPEWPIEKISVIDRNVLRIGLYELLFADRVEVPAKVAINESIELAKTFGGENSGRFVNGVLGTVYKELGEPGKDEVGKSKKRPTDVPYEKMPIERLAGAVVYAKKGGDVFLALVHDIFGHWTLSKGHLEENEDLKRGTARVVEEEMGLKGEVEEKLGDNEYIASDPEKGKLRKQVSYFLLKAPHKELTLKKTGGLDDTQWFNLKDILELNFYEDILKIVTAAINLLLKK